MDDSIAHQNQQDQPDSSSEIPLFTMIPPDGQSGSSSHVGIKNDSNNNNNDRNNNNGKSKLEGLGKMTEGNNDDDGNNNNKRHALALNNLQRYHLDNGSESPHHPSSVHHHHLLLLQQQQQMNQQMSHMDKQGPGNLITAPDNSPSLIVLQPSGQGGSTTYSPFFNHYATGK
jgi:hypothetical protein